MTAPRLALPWMGWPQTQALLAACDHAGIAVRFVGGCVRDALLGRAVHDIDLATPALPEAVTELLEQAGIRVIPTGIAHGTVTARIGEMSFEITTLRRDVACDGRHAQVAFTDDWREDAARRDFTMNALSVTPQGELFDYFTGIEDAQAGRVAFIGAAVERIREDALRILRYFRFHAHYGRQWDEASYNACAVQAAQVTTLSGERVHHEMLRLFAAPALTPTLARMAQSGVLAQAMGQECDVRPMQCWEQVEQKAGGEIIPLERLAFLLRHGALAPREGLAQLRQRWKLSVREHDRLRSLLDGAETIVWNMGEAAQKQQLRRAGAALFRGLVRHAWARELCRGAIAGEALEAAFRAMLDLTEHWTPPQFPLTGGDVLACGVPPGAAVGEALRMLEAYWEAEHYRPEKAQLLARLKRLPGEE